jgi:hypothetical protein
MSHQPARRAGREKGASITIFSWEPPEKRPSF